MCKPEISAMTFPASALSGRSPIAVLCVLHINRFLQKLAMASKWYLDSASCVRAKNDRSPVEG
jgi:hypothetical protein